jgi:glycerol-3-phosphate acyltransferase PlsY
MMIDRNPAPAKLQELARFPGLAAVALYLVLLVGVLILGVAGHHYPLLFLLFAPVFLAASAGLLLLLRWAWSLALAAVLLLAGYNFWIFSTSHVGPALVQGLLNMVFFFYLVRTQIRERLR